ncbi:PepSY-associated TM helix domain-containing protein [Hyalangium minutum]|uniref:Putative iron-regulated membrane protein n=1 Tax=Hyalangium minutum TaxID=394096 RepID=A0A085WXP5_9BACT|nr:PepSY-associated TM helix domain-containing protein [Hyalangium minutum]KFE72458.1 putative iron-regulated membrane protein [Hyalangium minutum]
MKVSPRAYEILWDAHAWTGVLSSIVLFALFFLGTFALFAEELAPWQEPSFRGPIAVSDAHALELAQRLVDTEVEAKPAWFGISLPTEEEPWLRIWRLAPGGTVQSSWMDPVSGQPLGERSDLGEFLNAMHFLDPIPGGKYLAGIASVVLLLLIVTGGLIQLGKLVRELVQFRPHQGHRVRWSDAHKVLGVVNAPFLLLFALTGTVLCLSAWLQPAVVATTLEGDARAVESATDWPVPPPRKGEAARAPDLRLALERAQQRFPQATHRWFFIDNLGDANAVVHLPGESSGTINAFEHVWVSLAGEIVRVREKGGATSYSRTMETLYGWHFATWAGLPVKVLYALLALLASFGILAGNLLWLERRRSRGLGSFDRLLEKLTAGGCAGLTFAVAALFLANQLLPAALHERPRYEHALFYVSWLGALGYALVERSAARSARRLLIGASGLLFAVPLIDAARTARIPFASGSPFVLATELGLVFLGLLLAGAARAVSRMEPHGGSPLPLEELANDSTPSPT